jgi:hypothetical protein
MRRPSPGRGQFLGQDPFDLPRLGEAALLLLREDQLIPDGDLEDSSRTLDELGLDTEFPLDLLRQTGGAREVVSDTAVFDVDGCRHGGLLPRWMGHGRVRLRGPRLDYRPGRRAGSSPACVAAEVLFPRSQVRNETAADSC